MPSTATAPTNKAPPQKSNLSSIAQAAARRAKKAQKGHKALDEIEGSAPPNFDTLTVDSPSYTSQYARALTYANAILEPRDLRGEFMVWLERNQFRVPASFATLPDYVFLHVGKIAWIENNGGELKPETVVWIATRVKEIVARCDVISNDLAGEVPSSTKKTVAEVLRDNTADFLASIEEAIDAGTFDLDVAALLRENNRRVDVKTVDNFYAPRLAELALASSSKVTDDDVKEAYASVPKKELKVLAAFLTRVIEASRIYMSSAERARPSTNNNGAPRKPRKVKVVSTAKLIHKLNYAAGDPSINLVSIAPQNIIGASQLWVYNKKTRKIGRYMAPETKTLSIKGSSIINYDEKLSIAKVLRKPDQQIGALLGEGKVGLRKFLDNIRAVAVPLNGRINNETVLVRVLK